VVDDTHVWRREPAVPVPFVRLLVGLAGGAAPLAFLIGADLRSSGWATVLVFLVAPLCACLLLVRGAGVGLAAGAALAVWNGVAVYTLRQVMAAGGA
jgi:hypothetical protein